nr:hypothetical protein [Tanacetum cinerariifolium]
TARISIPASVPMPAWTDSELPSASRREDRPEVTLPSQKRLGIALGPRYEVGESSSAATARLAGGLRADYGFVATGAPVSTDTELGGYVREFETRIRQDMDEIYMRLDDEQTERQLLAGRQRLGCLEKLGCERQMRVILFMGQVTALQAHVTTLQGQQGLAGGPTQPKLPEEADYGFVATVDREIMRDPEREVGYGITDSWDEIVETLQGAPVSTDTELGRYMREFETRVRHDTDEIYMRRAHAYTRHLMETEDRMSREAWVRATDASDLVHGEVMSLCTTVLGRMSEIKELQAADRRRQIVILELLRIDHRSSTKITELRTALQGQVIALQGQVTALQT